MKTVLTLCAAVASLALSAGEACSQQSRARPPAGAQGPALRPAAPRAPVAADSAAAPAAASTRVDDSHWQGLADRAEELLAKGNFPGAEQTAREALEEARKIFGTEHPNTAASHSILGAALLKQGRYGDADAQFRQAVAVYEQRSGAESVNVASALNNLALVQERMGDFSGAEALLRRAHRILEKARGSNHPDTATTLSNLGRVLDSQGKLGAGAAIGGGARQPDKSGPAAAGDNPQLIAVRVDELLAKGQFAEAESLQQRVVTVHERTLGAEHPQTATSLSNLGNVFYLQGKIVDAERVHRRVLAIREKILGPEHPDTATSLNNLANILLEQGKDERTTIGEQRARFSSGQRVQAVAETESLYRRAMSIQEKTLGTEHPALANTMNNLGALLDQQGKFGASEPLQRRALEILQKNLGPLHPDTAATLTTLAVSLDRQGKLVEAEQTYLRAVETSRNAGNPRTLLLNSSRLGFSLAKRGRYREALPFYREAIETLDYLYVRTRGLSEETRQAFLGQYSNIYLETIRLLVQLHRQSPTQGFDRQILEVASRNQSRTFTEMMRQADVARFSADPAFIAIRGRRDGLQERIEGLRQAIVTVPLNQPTTETRRAELTAQLNSGLGNLKSAEDELWKNFPRFMELTNPRPVTADDLQGKLLNEKEALVSFVLLPQEMVVFGVTRERFKMVVNPIRRDDISRRIHAIRRSIEKVTSGESVLFLREIDPENLHSLYRDLFGPVADVIAGRDQVIIVGDGPLHTLPMEMLVTRWGANEQRAFRTARAAGGGSAEQPFLGEYALPEYLGKTHRFAYLPSLSALTSQRLYPKQQGNRSRSLVAFADPEFAPDTSRKFSAATRSMLDSLGGGVPRARDGTPDIPRLKETAEEAREIAAILGGTNALHVGNQAQEKLAKSGGLRDARYVLFATHGFLGGELLPGSDAPPEPGASVTAQRLQKTAAQPALALSLVGELGGEDGMLTMKEVIEDVELEADLVALSACNTAGESAQANNGEGFAGLTRAFMYAGAKSLIVSHWSVDSLSTQALMTATFRNIRNGRSSLAAMSDAQRGMLAGRYASGAYHFSRSHPFFWAPFVFVGD